MYAQNYFFVIFLTALSTSVLIVFTAGLVMVFRDLFSVGSIRTRTGAVLMPYFLASSDPFSKSTAA